MKALVVKEIRLLLPAYVAALVLAIVPAWVLPTAAPRTTSAGFIVYPFWFGAVMLGLSAFGREFSLRTFSLTLAQPLERGRIWWTKIAVLAGAMATALAALNLSYAAWVYTKGFADWNFRQWGYWDWRDTLILSGTGAVVAFAGGLWTTLLLRQVAAAFWFAILVPGVIWVLTHYREGSELTSYAALGLYSIAGFLFAWRLFLRGQETAWTGGAVSLSGWRGTEAAASSTRRSRRPLAALCGKEFQLHQIGLAGMGCLFVLHLGTIALRKLGAHTLGETALTAMEFFWGFWLIVPLLAGGPSVAEERKLGTMEGHLCLPVSTRTQFAIKLIFVLVLAGLLSAGLLWVVEGTGSAIGLGGPFGDLEHPFSGQELAYLCLNFVGLALASVYASSLTRHLLQALAAAVVIALAGGVFLSYVSLWRMMFGFWLWGHTLGLYSAWPVLIITFIWLAYGNFRCMPESGHLWRRNLLGIATALVFITGATTAVYHRAWELVLPLEPAHGPARLAGTKRPMLATGGDATLAVLLPDGRLWANRFAYMRGRPTLRFPGFEGFLVGGSWVSPSGDHSLTGSNWVETVPLPREIVALGADGTLWGSEELTARWEAEESPPPVEAPARLVRLGEESHWQSVVAGHYGRSVFLLKQDGTLWRWGTNYTDKAEWRGLRAFTPQQVGTNSDWARLLRSPRCIHAWKQDGRAWEIYPDFSVRYGPREFERTPGYDNLQWRSLAREVWCQHLFYQMGVRQDGTLWVSRRSASQQQGATREPLPPALVQVGRDTNWVATAGDHVSQVALKADGTLWKWTVDYSRREDLGLTVKPPVRLGRHSDWVAVGNLRNDIVSLAADGSLWYWWDKEYEVQPMLAPPRTPDKIGNVLTARE